MHTKISDEYVIKKRGLRGLLSYVSSWCILILHQRLLCLAHRKAEASDEQVIKIR